MLGAVELIEVVPKLVGAGFCATNESVPKTSRKRVLLQGRLNGNLQSWRLWQLYTSISISIIDRNRDGVTAIRTKQYYDPTGQSASIE